MPISTPPELTRSDISLYVLQLKALGIDNVAKFDFMSPPPSEMMIRALEFLYCLKAIDIDGHLTDPLGKRMAEVPVDPMMAAIVSLTLIKLTSASQLARVQMWQRDLDYSGHDLSTGK
jgi:ATP-dependent RNA helicase DDX35